jgi:ATP-dependent Clp protease, protease subunit
MAKLENFTAEERINATLLESDIHYLSGEIEEDNVANAIKWILTADLNKKPKRKLVMYVNSEGGDLYQAFGLIDVMRRSTHTISTVGIGSIMSAAFLIFASGDKGHRYIGTHTGCMCHQFTTSVENKHHDIKAQMKENTNCDQRMVSILKQATDFSIAEVRKKLLPPSDVWFTAKQLIDLKIADHIL